MTAAKVKSRRRATNNGREETGLANQVTSTVEQGQSARTQWPGTPSKEDLTDVSGARGVAAPVPGSGQCRDEDEWTQKKNSQGWDPKTHEKKRAQPTASRQEATISRSTIHPDTVHSTRSWRRHVRRNAKFPFFKAAQRHRRTRQCSKLGCSTVAVRRPGPRDPSLGAEADWIQKIVEIPQLQDADEKVDITAENSEDSVNAADTSNNEKRVDDNVIMQTNSSSPSSTADSEDASDSSSGKANSSCAVDSVDRFSGDSRRSRRLSRSYTLCRDSARHPGDPEDR